MRRRDAQAPPPTAGYSGIWAVVRRIPRGRVATYGQVATLAGRPRQARFAGYAMHAAPPGLPWHRVVTARGALSVGRKDPATGLTQRMRLAAEGVRFDARGRVDLARHAWRPRRAAPAARGGER